MKTACLACIFFFDTLLIKEPTRLSRNPSLLWVCFQHHVLMEDAGNVRRAISSQVQQHYNDGETIWGKRKWFINWYHYLEYNSAHVVVAGPQLVLRPDQGLKRRLDELVHAVDVLLQRPRCVGRLPVIHEVDPAVKQGFQIVKSWIVLLSPPSNLLWSSITILRCDHSNQTNLTFLFSFRSGQSSLQAGHSHENQYLKQNHTLQDLLMLQNKFLSQPTWLPALFVSPVSIWSRKPDRSFHSPKTREELVRSRTKKWRLTLLLHLKKTQDRNWWWGKTVERKEFVRGSTYFLASLEWGESFQHQLLSWNRTLLTNTDNTAALCLIQGSFKDMASFVEPKEEPLL